MAKPEVSAINIREFEQRHAQGVLDVIREVYREYGFTWDDSSAYFADLFDIMGHYARRAGQFWVVCDGDEVIGTVGVTGHEDGECELHRLYLLAEYRGRRLGQRMLDTAMEWGRQRGYRRMIAWSDVKLPHAHVMYRANGFEQRGQRICDDPDKATEYGFFKDAL